MARDNDVLAFGEDERRKGADQLADDVATRRQHREGGVGERLARGFVDELERQRRAAMLDRNVDSFAGRDPDVGVDHRIGRDRRRRRGRSRFAGIGRRADSRMSADRVEKGGNDMVGPFRQSDDIACFGLGVDELAQRIAVLRHVNRQGQLRSVDRCIGQGAFDPKRARREGQPLGANPSGQVQAFGRAGESESDVNNVVAGRYGQGRLGQTGLNNQGMRAVRIGVRAEHPPAQAACERRAAAKGRGKTERRLGGVARRRRLSGAARRSRLSAGRRDQRD